MVVCAVDGATVNPENLIKSVGPTLPTTDRREVKVELTPDKAKSTTEDANAQVPKEVIGQFTTSFPHAD